MKGLDLVVLAHAPLIFVSYLEQDLLSAAEEHWLIACLIESADRVANTASIYGAFLKRVKASAQKPLRLVALLPPSSPHGRLPHRVHKDAAAEVLQRHSTPDHTLTYIDPPYNHRQYSANYHVLETIARWDIDAFQPTCHVAHRQRSKHFKVRNTQTNKKA